MTQEKWNTLLLAIAVSLSGWTLSKVSTLGEAQAATVVRNASTERELADIRTRITGIETRQQQLEIEVAKIKYAQ